MRPHLAAALARAFAAPGIVPAAFLAGLLFLFVPAQVYGPNQLLFSFALRQLAVVLLPAFVLAFALLAAIASLGSTGTRRATASVLAGLGIAAWITASFSRASTGLLDGVAQLHPAAFGGVPQLALYVGVALAAGWAAWRYGQPVRRLLAALFVLLFAQALWIAAHDPREWRPVPSFERLARLSPERNVLVVLLDDFQNDFFAEIAQLEPGLAATFEGFTWFSNATGDAPTTYFSLPVIHGGTPIVKSGAIRTIYERAVVNDSFMARLGDAGYDTMVANPLLGACPRGGECSFVNPLVHGQAVAMMDTVAFLESLALFRMVPRVLLPRVYNGGRWLSPWGLQFKSVPTANTLLDRMAERLNTAGARPAARFLHLFNSHPPAEVDGDCRPASDPTWTRAHAVAQDRCALRHVARLLEALRREKVYDRTTIVVLADHGAGLPHPGGFALGESASPLLLVKPFEAHGPLQKSARVVGLADVGATVCALAGCTSDPPGMNVLDARTADVPRMFPFVTYQWQAKYFGADAVPFIDVWELRGPPRDVASWTRTTRMPARVTELDFAPSDPDGTFGFGWGSFESVDGRTVRRATGDAADLYIDLDAAHDERLAFDVRAGSGSHAEVAVEVNAMPVARFAATASWTRQEVLVPRSRIAADRADRILLRMAAVGDAPAAPPTILFDRVSVTPAR